MRKKYYQVQYKGQFRNFHSFRAARKAIKKMPHHIASEVQVLCFKNNLVYRAQFIKLKDGTLTIRF